MLKKCKKCKEEFVEKYTEELTNYFEKEKGGSFDNSDDMQEACDWWINNSTLEELKKIILGDLTETEDGQFIGTKEQFNNSKIN